MHLRRYKDKESCHFCLKLQPNITENEDSSQ